MALRHMRRWSRLVAVVLLLASVGAVPHLTQDDAACANVPAEAYGAHQETQHGLSAAGPEHQDHCALCHWTRSLRSPRTDAAGWSLELAPPTLVHRQSNRAHAAPSLDNLPARAPPATL